jgi:hypothetical protein
VCSAADDPTTYDEPPLKRVLMSDDLFAQLGATVEWGEPDAEGFYTPTVYREAAAGPRDVPTLPPPDPSLIDTLGEGADPDRPVRVWRISTRRSSRRLFRASVRAVAGSWETFAAILRWRIPNEDSGCRSM